jgi:hypothetical protein
MQGKGRQTLADFDDKGVYGVFRRYFDLAAMKRYPCSFQTQGYGPMRAYEFFKALNS